MASTEKYKKIFLAEAEEKIATLNTAFLGLEKEPGNSALANDAMRAAHTLKSSAAAMNFMEMSHLAHAMEDVFDEVRTKGQTLAPRSIEILFNSVDTLSAALAAIKKGKPEPSTAALRKELTKMKSATPPLTPPRKGGENTPPLTPPRKGGETATISSPARGEARRGGSGVVGGVMKGKPDEGIALAQKPESIAPIEAIKVDVATLDKLMNLTEELLVEKMRLSELVRQAKEKPDDKLKIAEFESSSEAFNRLIPELQLNVTEARMVPLGQIFERFPRMVRDLAHEQSKEVDFDIIGQDIELDRTVIDRLGEPLIHLLRNAVDHGIEKTGKIHLTALQERDKVIIEVTNEGRPVDWQKVVEVAVRKGVIAKEKGEEYRLQIANFITPNVPFAPTPPSHPPLSPLGQGGKLAGRGGNDSISPPFRGGVRGGAVEGLRSEIENLLYRVSTKDKVTETSGRGVGLGIVKSVIESLGGKVAIESEGGTKFTLTLPLTLAIIQALLVRVGDQTFALPFAQIDRSVRVSGQNIKKAFDQEMAVVEDEDIPMVRLDKLFGIERKRMGLFLSDEEMEKRKTAQQAELMVITKRENFVGIMIDELLSTQDIVVKPFKGMLRQTKGFAGITLLGDGKPAMILDVPTLLERLNIKS